MDDQNQSKEQAKYKFNEIKTYSSTEWLIDNRKKYRQVFLREEVAYIYVEVSLFNKYFDVSNWEVSIDMKCYQIKNTTKEICTLHLTKTVSSFDPVFYIREGWGNKKKAAFWRKGTYYWEIWIDNQKVGTKYFYIEDFSNYGFDRNISKEVFVQNVKLYEGHYDDVPEDQRTYYTKFSSAETRYIYAEIELGNNVVNDDWRCELFVKFFNAANDLKGQVVRLHHVKKDTKTFLITAGWGSNTMGSWKEGRYSIDIFYMESFMGTIYFDMGDNFELGEFMFFTDIHPDQNESSRNDILLPSISEVLNFDHLVGLQNIKEKVDEHTQYIEFLKLRREKGFVENEPINIHAVFMGNPGTGKTTVAKLLGSMYKRMGLLSIGHVLTVDRVDLIGEYIGQTAPKVKEAIEKARGGILFIDEAYSLARNNDDTKDFGREVIEILIREMSNGAGDMAVIVAGYPKEMKVFIDSNPGIRSRFKHYFDFQDYLPQELLTIAENYAEAKEIKFTDEAHQAIKEIITAAYRDRNASFGNARYVEDLITQAKINLAKRLMARKNPSKLSIKELSDVQIIDVLSLKPKSHISLPDIAIDDELLREAFTELDALIGITAVKSTIHDMVQIVMFYKEIGKNVLAHFSLHTVFVGNPGTGKTTVARILVKIYKALGLLERGHIIETDRQGLVAGFVGQTAIKTAEKINEAIGGVLFIDEAYALTHHTAAQNDFGDEAIQTIIKKMEDMRGRFYVFAAGYPQNMELFLKANPGLNSRFDKVLKFEDYNEEQLNEIAFQIIKTEGFRLSPKAKLPLQELLTGLYIKRDKYFGNARTVRKLMLDLIQIQNIRLAAIESNIRPRNTMNLINHNDIEKLKMMMTGELIEIKTIGYK